MARFARYYTPLVLLAAVLIAFVPWAASDDHKVGATRRYKQALAPSRDVVPRHGLGLGQEEQRVFSSQTLGL